jgi:hypothetical protein
MNVLCNVVFATIELYPLCLFCTLGEVLLSFYCFMSAGQDVVSGMPTANGFCSISYLHFVDVGYDRMDNVNTYRTVQ